MSSDYFNDSWACQVTGLHRTTIARMRERGRLRPELVRLADIERGGAIGLIHPAWDGWQLSAKDGLLYAPCGWQFRPGELLSIPLRHQELNALRSELADRRRRSSANETRALEQRLRQVLAELDRVAHAVGRLRAGPGLAAVERESKPLPLEAPAA